MSDLLPILENEMRRRILSILSLRPSYIFELARFLNTSQQLVAKHIKALEKAGLVRKVGEEESPFGPKRILYSASMPMMSIIEFLEDFISTDSEEYNGNNYIKKLDLELKELDDEIDALKLRLKELLEKRQQLILKLAIEQKIDLIEFIENYIRNMD
jgi:Predicted transcriptional regulators